MIKLHFFFWRGGCLIWIISVVKLQTGFEAFGLPVKYFGRKALIGGLGPDAYL